jgi:hypothetical protein
MLTESIKRPLAWIRRGIRALGFDVVHYQELPHDLDPDIHRTIDAVRGHTMTSALRIAALCEAIRYVVESRIAGDIVECGVWKGGSMMAAALTLLRLGDATRDLFLFDTFEGMTRPSNRDISFRGQTAQDFLSVGERTDPASMLCIAPLEEVRKAMLGTGYDAARVHFVKGRVEDTIPAQAPERIALLRLDTDWYESTRHELEHLFPRLVPGGVLIIDDYGHWQGAREAVDEYLAKYRVPLLLHRIDYSARCAVKPG